MRSTFSLPAAQASPTGSMSWANGIQRLTVFRCAEFVQLISSEATEISNKEKKNTITPEHLLKAIQDLGFTDFLEEVTATMEQHKEESKGEVLSKSDSTELLT